MNRISFSLALLITAAGFAQNSPQPKGPEGPITGKQRLVWIAGSTLGPQSLAAGTVVSAWGNAFDIPREYDTGWKGFGKRYGLRLSGVATSNVMEAGIGAVWGEDPRYYREGGRDFKKRVGHIVKGTFFAYQDGGHYRPAYAR